MTTAPPDGQPGPAPEAPAADGPRVTRDEVRDLGRLRRTVGPDRKVAGVAGGLGRHLDIDPVLLRVAFVVLVFFGGSGLLLYAACWLLVPEDGRDRAPLHLDERNRSIALVVAGGFGALLLLGDSVGQWDFPWQLVVLAVIALAVLAVVDRDRSPRPSAPPIPHYVDPASGLPVPNPAYGATTGPMTGPGFVQGPAPVQPRYSRRRGPILFWFTLALAALAVGVVAIIDLAGTDVPPSTYPAVVVAACGLMLVVSAFYGRGGGLVLIGLLASVAMLVASLFGSWHGAGNRLENPAEAAAVHSDYRLSAGEIVLDLTGVADPAALDGRTIHLTVRTGRIEVIVPRGVDVGVDAHVTGAGHIILFGHEWDGVAAEGTGHIGSGTGAPSLTIDATVLAGEIDVHVDRTPAPVGTGVTVS